MHREYPECCLKCSSSQEARTFAARASCRQTGKPPLLAGLIGREQGNPTFLFLKPTHSLFGYFKDLCDAYSRTLMPPKELMAKLKRDAADRTALLERCLRRLEWEKQREAEEKEAADKAEAERLAMQSIDWYILSARSVLPLLNIRDSLSARHEAITSRASLTSLLRLKHPFQTSVDWAQSNVFTSNLQDPSSMRLAANAIRRM